MSEFKMQEKFDLPVDCFVSKVKLGNDCSLGFINIEGANGQDYNKHQDAEYVAHAINTHDGLVEQLCLKEEECKQLAQDNHDAIKLMSPSWKLAAEKEPDILTRFVKMANEQFEIRDGLAQDKAELVNIILELIAKSDCCIDLLNCSEERYLDYSSVKSVALNSVEKHK